MDSESPEVKKDFQEWVPLAEIEKNHKLLEKAKFAGTYIFRKLGGEKFGRLRGESDIIYIGSTGVRKGSSQTIYDRVYGDFILLSKPGRVTQRIHKLLMERNYLNKAEVAWCDKNIEAELLERYEADHDELPPWNRRMEK